MELANVFIPSESHLTSHGKEYVELPKWYHKFVSNTIELSFNSIEVLVESWLFCIKYLDSCVGTFLVNSLELMWRLEQKACYVGSVGAKLILAC